jgi:TetR/AcrR family transcriptional regulator
MARKPKAPAESLDSREALLKAAKKVFANKGFDGATVKDLADAAGVNVSMVSYYFDGKENLYGECLASVGRHHVASAQKVLKAPTTPEEFRLRLQLFAEEFIALNKSEEDICKIIQRDLDSGHPVAMEIFKATFVPMYDTLVQFIASAKSNGILRKNVDPDIATPILFGSLVHLVRMEPLHIKLKGYSLIDGAHLEKTIQQFIIQATQGIFSEKHL